MTGCLSTLVQCFLFVSSAEQRSAYVSPLSCLVRVVLLLYYRKMPCSAGGDKLYEAVSSTLQCVIRNLGKVTMPPVSTKGLSHSVLVLFASVRQSK